MLTAMKMMTGDQNNWKLDSHVEVPGDPALFFVLSVLDSGMDH